MRINNLTVTPGSEGEITASSLKLYFRTGVCRQCDGTEYEPARLRHNFMTGRAKLSESRHKRVGWSPAAGVIYSRYDLGHGLLATKTGKSGRVMYFYVSFFFHLARQD